MFSTSGEWLVTVDTRHDDEFGNDTFLKFWQYDYSQKAYSVNTMTNSPHRRGVIGLAIRPRKAGKPEMIITTSADFNFKAWELVKAKNENATGILDLNLDGWVCRSSSTFDNKQVPTCVAFSEDGSILAIAFGAVITLWDPERMSLEATFCAASSSEFIRHLIFTNASPYLIAATNTKLQCWNILTGEGI